MASSNWPAAPRMVLVDFPARGFKGVPAVVLETPPDHEQPAERVRLQLFPVNEFPEPMELPIREAAQESGGIKEPHWYWPPYVGPRG